MLVTTQNELNAAIARGCRNVEVSGNGSFIVKDNATVHAYDSATANAYNSATAHAYGNATAHAYNSATAHAYDSATVYAYGSATVHASGNATVHAYDNATVYAYDSATVHASGNATVHAYDNATVHARNNVTVNAHFNVIVRAFDQAVVYGSACVAMVRTISTIRDWTEAYGVEEIDGRVVLYKAVDDNYRTRSPYSYLYAPGTAPVAPDWDPVLECGGGLHFSPSPRAALRFYPTASRFVACPVNVDEIVVHANALFPSKVKAPRVCAPCWEVDINGKAVAR